MPPPKLRYQAIWETSKGRTVMGYASLVEAQREFESIRRAKVSKRDARRVYLAGLIFDRASGERLNEWTDQYVDGAPPGGLMARRIDPDDERWFVRVHNAQHARTCAGCSGRIAPGQDFVLGDDDRDRCLACGAAKYGDRLHPAAVTGLMAET